MKLPKKIILAFLLPWLTMPAAQAQEDKSFDIFPRAGIGLNWLNFVRLDDSELDVYFTTLNVGLTANYNQYYFDLGAELFGVDSNREGEEIDDVNRQDFTFTTGYLLNEDTGLFVGYTFGETKDDSRGDFHEDIGFFVGASYSFVRGENVYTTSLAYADLDGEIIVDGDRSASTEGDTTGFSLAFTISGPFRETLGYTASLKTRQYVYEVDGSDLDSDKAVTSLNLGLIF